jgi:hypothetical protein
MARSKKANRDRTLKALARQYGTPEPVTVERQLQSVTETFEAVEHAYEDFHTATTASRLRTSVRNFVEQTRSVTWAIQNLKSTLADDEWNEWNEWWDDTTRELRALRQSCREVHLQGLVNRHNVTSVHRQRTDSAAFFGPAPPTEPVSYLYSHAASLNDITAGSSGSCGGTGACTAEPGYDGPTGLGTPCGTVAFGTGPWQTTSCPAGSNNVPAAPLVSTVRVVGCGPTRPGWAQCMLAVIRGSANPITSAHKR